MVVCALTTARLRHWPVVIVCLLLGSLAAGQAAAQTVWSGFDFSFSRPAFADGTAPENQDMLTPNVVFARKSTQGLYNAAVESGFQFNVSPTGTAWATDLVTGNEMESIDATNWANLSFTDWADAYGGLQSGNLPNILTSRNAVVHLITDDIYLDIQFTSWGGSGNANFAYNRAVAPSPTPTGDYNGNGVVDAADYTVWRDTLGQNVTPGGGADGDADGMIDDGDYNFWKTRFGNTVPGTGSAGASPSPIAVPEPSALILAGLATLMMRRRGGRS